MATFEVSAIIFLAMTTLAGNCSDYTDTELLSKLAHKYSGSVPRYTSYPTAVEFSPDVGTAQWREELTAEFTRDRKSGVSLYLHIPFCRHHCYFCACNKAPGSDPQSVARYLENLRLEIDTYRALLGPDLSIEQIHWGGGSPNFLRAGEIAGLQSYLRHSFPNVLPNAEISFEADPRTLSAEHLSTLTECGFNRLSLGVQDFTTDVQQAIGRVQSFELTRKVCQQARALGIESINVDLIYGLPLQTLAGMSQTIDRTLELKPDRVAIYGYAHVPWLKNTQTILQKFSLPTPEERIALFAQAIKQFSSAGYVYIGLDHFALPGDSLSTALREGRLNRTFMGYTAHRGSRVLAFGTSAISIIPSMLVQNTKDLADYDRTVRNSGFAIERGVPRTRDDQLRAEIIEALLCQGRLDYAAFEQKWDIPFPRVFSADLTRLSAMKEDGLVVINERGISLSPLGRLFARSAAVAFDAYYARKQSGGSKVFSQAV